MFITKNIVWLLILKIPSIYFMLLGVLLSLKSPSICAPITLTNQLSNFAVTEITVGFYILYTLKNKELKSE
jgi:hypothetical protein